MFLQDCTDCTNLSEYLLIASKINIYAAYIRKRLSMYKIVIAEVLEEIKEEEKDQVTEFNLKLWPLLF